MATDEAQQIDEVVIRLTQRYPGIAPEYIADTVHTAYDRFADVHVRDFVPLLVERRATRSLSAPPA
ncbi:MULTISPECIES: three-helix bundle dimerization domain-containing protein [Nocardia]|uniref:three-helix bundle dimerization domain-containing protein n=1 Tax=Nocardia TaxID=1817 RepID=UPI00292D848D|nr:hypothetical protein [Nocardia canadensis]